MIRVINSPYYGKLKEVLKMKNAVKFGLVGLAGYLIGYYEHQYKTMKVILKAALREKENEEDEAQK